MDECHLHRLSDCVLMKLLSFLDATSLYQLGRTSKFFNHLVQDHQLWRYIDGRDSPNDDKKVCYVVNRIHNKSNTVLLRAQSYVTGLVPSTFFSNISLLDNVRILALENQYFDGETITIKNFPRNLEELSLRKTFIAKCKDFFRLSNDYVINLRVLILDDCQWVDCGCLMSISKYQNLEIISLVKCRTLDNDAIAYFGLGRLGYKKLRIFDSRFTALATPVLSSFFTNETLLAYYFQHERSYSADYGYVKDKSSVNSIYHCFTDMNDRALVQFLYIIGNGTIEEFPHSQLYVDPYGECTCNYKEDSTPAVMELDEEESCEMCGHTRILVQGQEIGLRNDYNNTSKNYCSIASNIPHIMTTFFSRTDYTVLLTSRESHRQSSNGSPSFKRRRVEFSADGPSSSQGNNEGPPVPGRQIKVSITQNSTRIEEVDIRPQNGSQNSSDAPSDLPGTSKDPESSRNGQDNGQSTAQNDNENREQPNRKVINVHIRRRVVNNDGAMDDMERGDGYFAGMPSRDREEQANDAPQAAPVPNRQECFVTVRRRVLDNHVEILPLEQVPQRSIPLRRLSLRGFNKVTDSSLTYLKDLQLDLVDLTYTACTAEGIRNYLSYNPNCRVIHKDFCRCKPKMPF